MKYIGLTKGNFKILEDADPSQLSQLSAEFAWADMDRIDTKAELALKDLYGVESLSEFGFPAIIQHEKYDLVIVNYYTPEQVKRELEVFVTERMVITVHQGSDPVCDEAMASINEMMVSGSFNSGGVLEGIFNGVIEKHAGHMQVMQEYLRNVAPQLKKGMAKVDHITKLNNDSHELLRVFSDTRAQIADIILRAVPVKGVKSPESFVTLYSQMNSLVRIADDFAETVDGYTNSLLPIVWNQIGKVKAIAEGFSVLSLCVAAAALFNSYYPITFMDIPSYYVVAGIAAIGLIGLIIAQRRTTFKLS